MSLQTRLFLAYVTALLLVAAVGTGIFAYVSKALENTLYTNLSTTASRMTQQLDSLITPMEYTSLHLLTNHRLLDAVEDIVGIDQQDPNNRYLLKQASNELSMTMTSYSFYKYFYRVSLFTNKGDFFTSNYMTQPPPGGYEGAFAVRDWSSLLGNSNGQPVVLTPYNDPWDGASPKKVFGVCRLVRVGTPTVGYIEVQQPFEALAQIFTLQDSPGAAVCAFTKDGSVFYDGGLSSDLLAYYAKQRQPNGASGITPTQNEITNTREIVIQTASAQTGISVFLVQDYNALRKPLVRLGIQTLTLYFFTVVISVIYIVLQTKNFVAPLRQLKKEMAATQLANLPEHSEIETSNNEIITLGIAFHDLKERLNASVEREIHIQSLHIQASFDSLQARVNPHFLYNILNLISNRAAVAGEDEICDICHKIASMLRYSMDITTKTAQIVQEVAHVRDYFFLMEERFEHRLHYTIEIAPEIQNVRVPKMILQPLVENAMTHGYESHGGRMCIDVVGWQQDGWRISVTDHGQGFSAQALEEIRQKKVFFDENPDILCQSGGALGGLGLINIYARLKLYYPQGFVMEIENNADGGACITIGGTLLNRL